MNKENEMSKILVVVDYQNDFVTGSLGFAGAKNIEHIIYDKIQTCLHNNHHVFFTMDTHDAAYEKSKEGSLFPAHCQINEDGWHLYGKVQEFENSGNKNIHFINKDTYGTAMLPDFIESTQEKSSIEEIELCGVVTNICVIANAFILQSRFFDSSIAVDSSACASFDDLMHNYALEVMRSTGIKIY
jgi:nicotinamidase-related amidase